MASNAALKQAITALIGLDYRPSAASVEAVASAWRRAFSDLTDEQLMTSIDRFVLSDQRGYWPKPGELRRLLIQPVTIQPVYKCGNCKDRGYATHWMVNANRLLEPIAKQMRAGVNVHVSHIPQEQFDRFTVECALCDAPTPDHARRWEDLRAQGYRALHEGGQLLDVTQ